MAKKKTTFEGLPFEIYAALAPLVDKEKGNQQALMKRFLDSWHSSSYSHFSLNEDHDDRELAESRLVEYAKLWVATQLAVDGDTQRG
jgi:hypothetical protein